MTKLFPVFVLVTLSLSACASAPKNTPSKQNEPKIPALKNAEVKTIWIPDRIEGNRYEEGHFVHLIDKPASWSGQ